MLRRWSVVFVLGWSWACGKSNRSAPGSSTATPSPTVITGSAAKPTATDVRSQENALLTLAQRWNTALASRRADDLRLVYAANVNLYGKSYGRDAAVALKAATLAKSPDYTQSLGPIAIDWKEKDHPRAVFEKKWSQGGKSNTVMASLTFGAEGGQWRVANESDGKTDLHKTQTDRKNETCGDTVVDLVMSTKEAKALVRGVSRSGTRLNDDTNPYTVAVHESTDDRFVTLGWFDVDIRTGAVKSTIPEEKLVMVSPELAAKTVAACAARPR